MRDYRFEIEVIFEADHEEAAEAEAKRLSIMVFEEKSVISTETSAVEEDNT